MTTSHLRRFAKVDQLPNSLKCEGSLDQGVSEASSPQTIYVLIPPPLPDISTLQSLLLPYAPSSSTIEQGSTSVNIQSTRILSQPPTSLERAEFFSKEFWPTIYNPSAHPAAHSPPPSILTRTKQDLEPDAGIYLALAKKVAEEAKELGRGRPVGVVAVDPALAKNDGGDDGVGNELRGVVAVAGDARYCGNAPQDFDFKTRVLSMSASTAICPDQGGPDKHALMRLIAIIADRRLSETSKIRSLSRVEPNAHQKSVPLSPLESSFLHSLPPSSISQDESKEPPPDFSSDQISSINGFSVDTEPNASTGPYLCTSLDVYSTHDPCPCCSMGMVLSRFRAVVFIRDETRVGLGGLASTGQSESSGPAAGYGLNWRRELNWRVLGFEFVEERAEEKDESENQEEKFHA